MKRPPGWEPSFGRATRFDRDVKAYDYMFLLRGNVPEATSHSDAESKIRELLDEIAQGLKSLRSKTDAFPKPVIRSGDDTSKELGLAEDSGWRRYLMTSVHDTTSWVPSGC